jgi:hypothetical protein
MDDKQAVEDLIESCRRDWIMYQILDSEWEVPPTETWLPPWINTQDHPRQNPRKDLPGQNQSDP